MRGKLLLLILPIFIFCAQSTKNFRLASISDQQPRDEHAVSAFVTLDHDSNTVAIFNWGKYEAFMIYKARSPQDTFLLLGELNAGPPGSSLSLLPFFVDKSGTLDTRYQVRPFQGGDELMQIPVIYETPDKVYFQKIEKSRRR